MHNIVTIKKYAVLAQLVLVFFSGYSRDFYADIASMKVAIEHADNLHIISESRFYKDNVSDHAMRTEKMEIRKMGANQRTIFLNMEVLSTPEATVTVDNGEKTLLYYLYTGGLSGKESMEKLMSFDVDSVLRSQIYKIEQEEKGDALLYRVFLQPGSWIAQLDYYLSVKTGLVERLVYYYDTEHFHNVFKVETVFSIDTNPVFRGKEFSVRNYVREQNGAYIPAPGYVGYELHVHDNTN